MYILGVAGSPRSNGNTHHLMKEILRSAEAEGAAAECIQLSDYTINGCIGCEKCRRDKTCTRFYDGMHLLYDKIEKADGLVLASPTYNYNMTPLMKAFIDRLYPYYNFTDKRPGPYSSRLAVKGAKALVFGVCEQKDPKESGYNVVSMADAIEALGFKVFRQTVFPLLFAADAARKDDHSMALAAELGKLFVQELSQQHTFL